MSASAMPDLGLSLWDAPTEELRAVEVPTTRPIGVPTSPAIPTLRVFPRVTYPPPVPPRPEALTTVLPRLVRA